MMDDWQVRRESERNERVSGFIHGVLACLSVYAASDIWPAADAGYGYASDVVAALGAIAFATYCTWKTFRVEQRPRWMRKLKQEANRRRGRGNAEPPPR